MGLTKNSLKATRLHWILQQLNQDLVPGPWIGFYEIITLCTIQISDKGHGSHSQNPKFQNSASFKGKHEGFGVPTRTLSVIALLVLLLGTLASLSTKEGAVAHPVTSLGATSTRGSAAAPHSPGLPLPIHWKQNINEEANSLLDPKHHLQQKESRPQGEQRNIG